MAKFERRIALVTGASSGIGQAAAERLAKAGYTVYGTSRRGTHAGTRSFHMLPLDVTSDASVEAAVGEVMRLEGRIDLLVNNAGFGVAPGGAEESSIEQARSIFETNFFGLIRMTRAVVPHMRRQRSGRSGNASRHSSRSRPCRSTAISTSCSSSACCRAPSGSAPWNVSCAIRRWMR